MADVVEQFSARSHARIHALRLLYQRELTGVAIDDIIAHPDSFTPENEYRDLCEHTFGSTGCAATCEEFDRCEYRAFFAQYPSEPNAYTCEIARGVVEQEREIDALLDATSDSWPVSRMPIVDRNIARIAIWELLRRHPEVPASVAINEAVQIAKEYGGEDSAMFINGVLGEIDKRINEGEAQ